MEYNEPLNLSVKKKPIAVVIPSSSTTNNKVDGTGTGSSGSLSNDADDPSERLDTSASPSGGLNDSDNVNRSTPMPHLDDTNTCHNATIDLVSVRPCPPTLNTRALLYVSVCTCNAVNQMNVLHMQSKPNQTKPNNRTNFALRRTEFDCLKCERASISLRIHLFFPFESLTI